MRCPMGIEIIDFYYFSGTGNTYLVVKKMTEVFKEKGITVNLFRIEDSDPEKVNVNHTIGLGFPVAVQTTYRFIWDFIEDLPEGAGTEIFMVDTLAQFSGAIVGPLKKFLAGIGYKPIGAKEIIMPSNFLPKTIDEAKDEEKRQKGIQEAGNFAEEIIEGKSVWKDQTIIADLFASLCKGQFAWNMLAKEGDKFRIKEDACKKCSLCAKLCPVENIEMNEFPRFLHKCQQCMRCISFCPVNAIYMQGKTSTPYRGVKSGELLKN